LDSTIRIASLLTLLAAGITPLAAQSWKVVKDVRYVSLGDTTRVVVELSGEVEFRDERIDGPDRVFIDLRGASPRRNGIAINVGDQAIKRIRLGENQPGVTRLVFDIENRDVQYKVSRLVNPERLIIEFARTSTDRLMITPAKELLADSQPGTKTPVVPVIPPMPEVEPETAMEYPPFVPPKVTLPKPKRPVLLLAEPRVTMTPTRVPPAESTAFLAHNRLPSTPPPSPPPPRVAAPPVQVAKSAPAVEKPAAGIIVAKKPEEPYSYKPKDGSKGPYPTEPALPGNARPDGSMIRALGLKIGRIVIDPGHGGQDFGATGPTGLNEKDVTLDISLRLAEMLNKRLGAEVVLLRNDDTAISPERRTEMANESKADLFLSIHANSSSVPAAAGIETFYLSVAASNGASDVAARENASSQRNVHEMQGLLEKIALNAKVSESREFAARVQRALVDSLKGLDRGVKRAPFIVLIGAQMPAILAEVGFISNPRDEARMKQPAERQKIAESLFKGIASYAASLGQYEVAQRTE
jgi:N-acetylmuramoyl-L-alanine amidase